MLMQYVQIKTKVTTTRLYTRTCVQKCSVMPNQIINFGSSCFFAALIYNRALGSFSHQPIFIVAGTSFSPVSPMRRIENVNSSFSSLFISMIRRLEKTQLLVQGGRWSRRKYVIMYFTGLNIYILDVCPRASILNIYNRIL